jgi:hydroxymethylbilane synthase
LICIGTRGSTLALAQARWVAERLGDDAELVSITTSGDRDSAGAEDKSRWTNELEQALLAGKIDVAVHSAKDVPAALADGLVVLAIPLRADPRDVICGARSLGELAPGARVGTSSLRRMAQIRAARPDLEVVPLRGNVDTRLRKARERGLDALVLACCGLDRLGLTAEIGLRLPLETMLPEAGQGAVALQVRAGDEELVAAADHAETRRRVEAERACASSIGAGCLAPVAVHHDGTHLQALIAAEDGSWLERATGEDPVAVAAGLLELARA